MNIGPGTDVRAPPLLRQSRALGVIDVVLFVVLGLSILVHMAMLSRMDGDTATVFRRALLLSTILSIVPIGILWFLDRRERESPWLLAAAFLWGGLIATTLSIPLNTAMFGVVDRWIALNPLVIDVLGPDATSLIAAPLSAPIVEETVKAVGVGLIFWMLRGEFDGARDGFIYGALVGVGFNWFEAPLYVMQKYAETGLAPYASEIGLRQGLLGLGGHAMFSGLFGLCLGIAAQTSRRWLRWLLPALGLLLAIGAHTINNAMPLVQALRDASAEYPVDHDQQGEMIATLGLLQAMLIGSIPQLTTFLPLAAFIAIALWRSGVWERRVIRTELASEVGGSVTPDEYQAILKDRALRTRRIQMAGKRSPALVNAQNELAFRKHRVRAQGGDPQQDPIVTQWRQVIEHIRGDLGTRAGL